MHTSVAVRRNNVDDRSLPKMALGDLNFIQWETVGPFLRWAVTLLTSSVLCAWNFLILRKERVSLGLMTFENSVSGRITEPKKY